MHHRDSWSFLLSEHCETHFVLESSHCDRIHSSLTAVRCFDNDYVGKQPVARREYCSEYWFKELKESMGRCTDHCDITELLLKTALNTTQSILQLTDSYGRNPRVNFNSLSNNPNFKRPETEKPFESIVGKGENAGIKHFLLFPQCFLPFTKQLSNFQSHLLCRLQMLSIWTSIKFCRKVNSYICR